MGSRNYEDVIIAAKIEAAYATDSAPTGADAIFAYDPQVEEAVGTEKEKKTASGSVGNSEKSKTGLHNKVSFKVPFAGSGTAGDAPAYGSLLRACGFSETIAVGVDVKYLPISQNLESITLKYEHDGDVHTLLGARGSVKIHFPRNEQPYLQFDFVGLYVPVAAGTIATPNFTAYLEAVEMNYDNTQFSFFGYSAILQALEISMDRKPELRDLPNQKAINAQDKSPSGSITFDSMKTSVKDFFDISKSGTKGVLSMTHGLTAGNIIEINIPKLQFQYCAYANDNKTSSLTGGLWPLPNTGDDDIQITIK
jgi:hypothetical protein